MLSRLGIRAKVLAVLAVPMLVVLLAGAFISVETLQNLRDARVARQVVQLVTAYQPLGAALDDERVAALTGAAPEEQAAARQRTDSAVADFTAGADDVDLSGFSAGVGSRLDEVERQLADDLPQTRINVDNGVMRVVGTAYASFVDSQLALFDQVAQELPNRGLASYVAAYVDVARTADSLAEEYAEGVSLVQRTDDSPSAGQAFTATANETEVLRNAARASVANLGRAGVELPADDPSVAFTQIRSVLGTGSVVQISAVSQQVYANAYRAQVDSFGEVSGGVLSAADSVAARAITTAQQRAVLTIGVAVLAAVASFALGLLLSRAIVIPLRRLTAAAADLREQLPVIVEQVQVPGEGPQVTLPQIPVTSRDEVGRLAAAFNSVNATTIHVAQEQAALRGSIAEMFVNVARRDQVLLNRQLSFIDSLERTEEDPQALANLFRLDHLATRMRRNAESLLVLAGIDSGRRLRDALPLSDVVRTASSEIEQYDRIQLDLQADPHMLGFNALPAAHLLAELLENATVFSEPETPVTVTTAVAGPYVEVRILDQGLGMTEAELAAANEKIVSTSAGDALGAQRLGLFVVGRLAQRLSTQVVLRKSQQGPTGTETVVRFPANLFQSTEASPLGVYGESAARLGAAPPEVEEVDLAALTDGATDSGLPRRRTGDAPAQPVSGLPVRPRNGADDEGIVLPEVEAATLPADLGAPDWTPLVVPTQAAGLPSRTPAASADAPGADAARQPSAADPAARAGLFAGFRGRGELAAGRPGGAEAPGTDDVPEAVAASAAEPALVVPGLAPDEPGSLDEPGSPGESGSAAWPATEAGAVEATWGADDDDIAVPAWPALAGATDDVSEPSGEEGDAEPVVAVAEPAAEPWAPAGADETVAPSWPSWAAGPSWAEPATGGYVPAAYQPEPAAQAAPTFGAPTTAPGADEAQAAPSPAEPDAEPWTTPSAEPWAPVAQAWDAPEPDVAQWPGLDTPAPTFEAESGAFDALSGWTMPAATEQDEAAPYVPFERGLDEARAWATGAIPVVAAPADDRAVEDDAAAGTADAVAAGDVGPDVVAPVADAAPESSEWAGPLAEGAFVVPELEPDVPAWAVAGEAETTILQPVALAPDEVDEAALPEAAAPAEESAPVEATAVAAVAAEMAPADVPVPTDEAPAAQPAVPAWAPRSEAPAESFAELVRGDEPEAKRRRWSFGRRRQAEPAPEPAAPLPPVPAPPAPPAVRTSAWATPPPPAPQPAPVFTPEPQPEPAASETTWAPQASWMAPVPPPPEPVVPRPATAAWSPPEWAPRPAAQAETEHEPAAAEPSSDTRIGTLDDEVAAMLALRSDIQEQALSELSQLSAYRPQVVAGAADRLTRRVPSAVPEAAELSESATAADRDPDELRSRLASFQSGTARGRREAGREE